MPSARRDLARTRSRARPSGRPRSPAPARGRRGPRRARAEARRGRPPGPDRASPATRSSSSSGSQRRTRWRSATSRQVLTTSRWSQVANWDSPRNWRSRRQSLASASWAASRASSGSASTCAARRSTRGACRSQSAASASAVAVLCSLDQDRVTQLLVDERPLGPRVLTNLTALAQRRLHSGPSLRPVRRLARAGGRRSAAARALRPGVRPTSSRRRPRSCCSIPTRPRGPSSSPDEQTAGRGRLGRRWLAPAGNEPALLAPAPAGDLAASGCRS